MNTKTMIRVVVPFVALATIGVIVAASTTGGGASQPGAAQADKPSGIAQPPAVEVTQPVRKTVTRDLHIPATFMAYEAVDLLAKSSGFVSAVNVDIGSLVRAGEPLVVLDIPEMKEDLRQAEANHEARRANVEVLRTKEVLAKLKLDSASADKERVLAEAELARATTNRKQQLHEGKAISDQEFEEAQVQLAVANAMVALARSAVAVAEGEQLAAKANTVVARAEATASDAQVKRIQAIMQYASIVAPFDGIITARMVDPGAFVRSASDGGNSPLVKVANTRRLRLVLDIPEPDVPSVRIGTKVMVNCSALGGSPLKVTIVRTAGVLDPRTRTMRIEADIENTDGRLAAGMYAQTTVKIESEQAALLVPSKAIRSKDKNIFVLVAQENIAKAVLVSVGRDDGIWAEIASGLTGDEWVITAATSAVSAGHPVSPMPVNTPSSSAAQG